MNQLLNISEKNASTLTMSSREIAELCGKRHDNVLKLIRDLLDGGLLKNTRPHQYQHQQNNQVYVEFLSDKRDSLVIVARLSPEFTAAVVDRWQELETQQNPTELLPQNYLQALEKLVETEREKQALALENQAMRPKAEFVDHYVDVGTTKSLRETAKILNMPERKMIDCLVLDKFLYRQSGNLLPYQKSQERGLFTVKTGTAERGHNFTQTRVTSKGIEFIASRYASELML